MKRDLEIALRKRLTERIGAERFELWFERYGSPKLEDNRVRICSPDQFTLDWIRNAFHQVLVVACLLYTSPSPRDKSSSRMPSSA